MKLKATLCKNKNGYGNKYSLVLSLLFSWVRVMNEGDYGKASLTKPGEKSVTSGTRAAFQITLQVGLTCLSWTLVYS